MLMSILLSSEMEVDGDLKVTGSLESTTIDSLQQYVLLMEAERQIDKRFISLSLNYNFGTVKKLSTGDKNFYQSKEQPLDMDY